MFTQKIVGRKGQWSSKQGCQGASTRTHTHTHSKLEPSSQQLRLQLFGALEVHRAPPLRGRGLDVGLAVVHEDQLRGGAAEGGGRDLVGGRVRLAHTLRERGAFGGEGGGQRACEWRMVVVGVLLRLTKQRQQ